MRIGPIVHGLLLVVALLFSYRAWTAEDEDERDTGDIVVWSESADSFESLTFTTDNKEVVIERRGDQGDRYLWGKVTRTRKKVNRPPSPHPMPPQADPHGHGASQPDPHGHGGGAGGAAKPGGAASGEKPTPAPAKKAAPAPAKKAAPAPAKKAAPAPAKKAAPAPAKETDGSKANQNDQIEPAPGDAKPAGKKKPAPAPGKKKPAPAPRNEKPAPAAGGKESGEEKAPAAGGEKTPDAKADDGAGADDAGASATEEVVTTTREFPVGEAGEELVGDFSQLRAVRELGTLDEEAKLEYGLDGSEDRLTVAFAGGKKHTLLVGDRVFGGSERYVLDEGSGKGYVLSGDVMRNVDAAETALGLKKYHAFDMVEDLQRVAVQVEGTEQVLVRLEIEEEEDADEATPETRDTWARSETPDQEDVTMANFVDRVSKLRPIDYEPDLDPSSLRQLARFSYRDASGKELGYMVLYKGTAPSDEDEPEGSAKEEYYMKTEKTRVLGRVSRLTAERVDNDLTEVFSGLSGTEEQPAPGSAPAPGEPTPPGEPAGPGAPTE